MTEADWFEQTEPEGLLELLDGYATERRLLLFACACVRRIWDDVGATGQHAIEVTEQFADRAATEEEWDKAEQMCFEPYMAEWRSGTSFVARAAYSLCMASGRDAAGCAAHYVLATCCLEARKAQPVAHECDESLFQANEAAAIRETGAQCALIRDIFHPPFHPVSFRAEWRTWQNATVVKLAQAAYDDRSLLLGHLDSQRVLILADALEEAGCNDSEVLGHLRGPGPHVRGCWVVDLILGKD